MLHLNIGICDDDKLYIKEITKLLDRYMIQYDIDISYDTFTSPLVLLNRISTTPGCYDILFLDVEMSEMNGLELSEKIRSIRRNIYTIFISNYPKCTHIATAAPTSMGPAVYTAMNQAVPKA